MDEICVVKVQSAWKSCRVRKKIRYFSNLPHELWNIILYHIRRKSPVFININRILNLRVTLLYWTHPSAQIKTKLHTLYLIRKYKQILDKNVKLNALQFTFRLMEHVNARFTICSLLVNSTIECLLEPCIANLPIL